MSCMRIRDVFSTFSGGVPSSRWTRKYSTMHWMLSACGKSSLSNDETDTILHFGMVMRVGLFTLCVLASDPSGYPIYELYNSIILLVHANAHANACSTIVAHVNFGEGRLERHMAHKFARVKRLKKPACVIVVISSS